MNRAGRRLGGMIALLVVALAGLMVLQVHLLGSTLAAKEEAFARNVRTALASAALRQQARDLGEGAFHLVVRELELETDIAGSPVPAYCDSAFEGLVIAQVESDLAPAPDPSQDPGPNRATGQKNLTRRVLSDLSGGERPPLAERIDPARLDSLLTATLAEVGITNRFAVGIARGDSLVQVAEPEFTSELRTSPHRARLFPLDLAPPLYELVVFFPAGAIILLGQIWPLIAAAVAFSGIIVFCFVQAIRTIVAQKRFAARLTDFVNNMTHELKTPIATVTLAGEALASPEVGQKAELVRRYGGMIRQEGERLDRHVERILELARLESNGGGRVRAVVDLHRVVAETAGGFALPVEQAQGSLDLDLAAQRSQVLADPAGLDSVVANLLDNAVKYAGGSPRVTVSTFDTDGAVVLRVADRGIGVPESDRERVFEKYYRCPTGDRHDVKGFGLGLCYVKLLVEADGGTVDLCNRPGGGVTVTSRWPLAGSGSEQT